jgi:hypothetical protein
MSNFYLTSGMGLQLAIAAVMLYLLLGALVLRKAVAWRNERNSPRVSEPSMGRAIGTMGLSLLLTAAVLIGVRAAVFVAVLAGAGLDRQAGAAQGLMFWLLLPFVAVALFLGRASVVARSLPASYEDSLLIQLYELMVYFVATVAMGILVFLLLLTHHLFLA